MAQGTTLVRAAIALDPRYAAAYALAAICALLRVNPTFSAATFAAGHAFKDADKRRLFGEHLVLAGLPE